MFIALLLEISPTSAQYICTTLLLVVGCLTGANLYVTAKTKHYLSLKDNYEDYEFSFLAKLIQGSDDYKRYYLEIVNEMNKNSKVEKEFLWDKVNFNLEGTPLSSLSLNEEGHLVLNLALDPTPYIESKYQIEDMKEVKEYEAFPVRVKIRNDEELVNAKELINDVYQSFFLEEGIDHLNQVEANALNYQNTDLLIENKLVRLINPPIEEEETTESINERIRREAGPIIVYPSIKYAMKIDSKDHNKYNKSFMGKLVQLDEVTKSYFCDIVNYYCSFKKVKVRYSWANASINAGRDPLAKFSIRNGSLFLYLALDPLEYEGSIYHPKDFSNTKRYQNTPFRIKINSLTKVEYAEDLFDEIIRNFELLCIDEPKEVVNVKDFPYDSNTNLIRRSLAKLIEGTIIINEQDQIDEQVIMVPRHVSEYMKEDRLDNSIYRKSFLGKLKQANIDIKKYYVELANYFLSYKPMHHRYSFVNDTFTSGRYKVAKFAIRGKSLFLYLAIDPEAYEGTKYSPKDYSHVKRYELTPFRIKINSSRKVEYAEDLFDEIIRNFELTSIINQKEHVELEDIEYASNSILVEQGLAKLIEKKAPKTEIQEEIYLIPQVDEFDSQEDLNEEEEDIVLQEEDQDKDEIEIPSSHQDPLN